MFLSFKGLSRTKKIAKANSLGKILCTKNSGDSVGVFRWNLCACLGSGRNIFATKKYLGEIFVNIPTLR